jgi:hypothetical protein
VSRVNRYNSKGAMNPKFHNTISDLQRVWLATHKWPSHLFSTGRGGNVIGTAPDLGDRLFDRNQALAEPRNDPRFKDINSMHPKRTGKIR